MPFSLDVFSGLAGILTLLGVAYFSSNNKSAINWRLVVSGLALQIFLAVFCLKFEAGRQLFQQIGAGIEKLLSFSDQGGGFVFGFLVNQPEKIDALFGAGSHFIFAFKLVPTIIFVATLVGIAYHIGLMQMIVKAVAWAVYRIMGASGAEALSNAASIFVGQVEAQLLVKPYVSTMTKSELLAVMAGSMACIAGGVMAVYIQMGVPAAYLLTASLMAVPGALVISKMVYPETEASLTRGSVQLEVEKHSVNVIHAAAIGAGEGLKIGLGVCAMLIGFIALIGMIDFGVAQVGLLMGMQNLSLNVILGSVFQYVAILLGVPLKDAQSIGALMGTKMVLNEFVAYVSLTDQIKQQLLDPKSIAIASFALCGFANFSSIAMQIGGIGEMAPERKKDLAELGMRALLCGTMASYVSSAWAGILMGLPANGSAEIWPIVVMVVMIGVIVMANRLPQPEIKATVSPTSVTGIKSVQPIPTGNTTPILSAAEIAQAAALSKPANPAKTLTLGDD